MFYWWSNSNSFNGVAKDVIGTLGVVTKAGAKIKESKQRQLQAQAPTPNAKVFERQNSNTAPLTEAYYQEITGGNPNIPFNVMRTVLGKKPLYPGEVAFLQGHPNLIPQILEGKIDVADFGAITKASAEIKKNKQSQLQAQVVQPKEFALAEESTELKVYGDQEDALKHLTATETEQRIQARVLQRKDYNQVPLCEMSYRKLTNNNPRIPYGKMNLVLKSQKMTPEEVIFLQGYKELVPSILEGKVHVADLVEEEDKIKQQAFESLPALGEIENIEAVEVAIKKIESTFAHNNVQKQWSMKLEDVDYHGNKIYKQSVTQKLENVDYYGNPIVENKNMFESTLDYLSGIADAIGDGLNDSAYIVMMRKRVHRLGSKEYTHQFTKDKERAAGENIGYQFGKVLGNSPLIALEVLLMPLSRLGKVFVGATSAVINETMEHSSKGERLSAKDLAIAITKNATQLNMVHDIKKKLAPLYESLPKGVHETVDNLVESSLDISTKEFLDWIEETLNADSQGKKQD